MLSLNSFSNTDFSDKLLVVSKGESCHFERSEKSRVRSVEIPSFGKRPTVVAQDRQTDDADDALHRASVALSE